MMHSSRFLPILAMACLLLFGSDRTLAQTPDPEAKALARELIKDTGADRNGLQMSKIMLTQVARRLKSANPGREEVVDELINDVLAPVIERGMPSLVDEIAKFYAINFTTAELNELLEFYRTPVGRKLVATAPAFLEQSMAAGQAWSGKIFVEAFKAMEQEVKARGLNVPARN